MSVFTNRSAHSLDEARTYTTAILGLLGSRDPVEVLRGTAAGIETAITGLSTAELSTPEAPGKWSMRHVVRHLADSEIVWAWRLRLILAQERPPIAGYDQDLWADRLHYTDADLAHAREEFRVLRSANLRLLAHVSPDDLARVGVHAERGDESVAHLIKLYAGHDLLHLNQLARIRAAISAGASS